MRIGIDCRQIYDVEKNEGAGVERYVYNLTKALLKVGSEHKHKFVLFFNYKISEQTIKSLKRINDFKVIKVRNWLPFFSNHVFFTFKLWAEFLHWMIFPANIMPFLYVGKSLLIVHDMAIYAHPEWFPNEQWFVRLINGPSSLVKATKIVTISKTTRIDILDQRKLRNERKVKVVYPGVTERKEPTELAKNEVFRKFNIFKPYLLFVGTIEPRKNLPLLFEAFKIYLSQTKVDLELIVAGDKGWKYKPIFEALDAVNNFWGKTIIRYIGKITDRERDILMQHCEAFVFPSYYEGFGLPVFEAMASGAPVICSKIGVFDELIHDEALKVNIENPYELSYVIKKILTDQEWRQKLIAKGKKLVEKFTWSKTAKDMLKIIELP